MLKLAKVDCFVVKFFVMKLLSINYILY